MVKYLLTAAALTGCIDTAPGPPFRAEILVRDTAHQYSLETVALPDLTSLTPLSDPIMRFSDHPHFGGVDLEYVVPSVFAAPSDYVPRIRDVGGVAVSRDLETLLTLSAYHALKDNLARAKDVFGPLDQLIPPGGFQILVEPKFSSDFGSEELGTNAAYISNGQAFLLVQMSSLEQVPLGMNPSVLAHELGHHVFHITYHLADGICRPEDNTPGPVPPGRFSFIEAIGGFNEGFADFTAFALQQETSIQADSLPLVDGDDRTIDRRDPFFRSFTWNTRELCHGGGYCIGTLWARAMFETYLATGAVPSDPVARSTFAQTVTASIAGIPGRLRQRSDWPAPPKPCEFGDLDDEVTLVHAYLEAFIAGLPMALQPSACTQLAYHFDYEPAGCP